MPLLVCLLPRPSLVFHGPFFLRYCHNSVLFFICPVVSFVVPVRVQYPYPFLMSPRRPFWPIVHVTELFCRRAFVAFYVKEDP
jgi:hypothetical protein